jgi:hypothetical protein
MDHSFIKIKIASKQFQLINTDIPDTPNFELNDVKSKFDDMPEHIYLEKQCVMSNRIMASKADCVMNIM